MSIKSIIQDKFLLPRKIRKHSKTLIDKEFIPIKSAVSIAIVADIRSERDLLPVIEFYKLIKAEKREIRLLLFVPEERNELNIFSYEKHFPGGFVNVVCINDINNWGVPKLIITSPFVNHKYDIAFRLSTEVCFEVDWLMLSIRSRMYAGMNHEALPYLDFAISLDTQATIKTLCENLFKYLTALGSKPPKTKSDHSEFRLF